MHHFYLSVRFLYFYVLADNHLRTEVESQSDDKSQAHLADDFELTVQAFLVLLEYLDVVVGKAQRPQPDCGNQHQYHINIAQFAQQQAGNEYGKNNDDTAHAGYSHLVYAERVDAGITLRFGNLLAFQQVDELISPDTRNEQCQNDCHQRTEGCIAEHASTGEVIFV